MTQCPVTCRALHSKGGTHLSVCLDSHTLKPLMKTRIWTFEALCVHSKKLLLKLDDWLKFVDFGGDILKWLAKTMVSLRRYCFQKKWPYTTVAEPTAIACECGGPQIQQLLWAHWWQSKRLMCSVYKTWKEEVCNEYNSRLKKTLMTMSA